MATLGEAIKLLLIDMVGVWAAIEKTAKDGEADTIRIAPAIGV